MRARELLRDLKARVAATDDKHPSGCDGVGVAVGRAVELPHSRVEALRERGYERDLERAGGHDDLFGLVHAVVELDQVGAVRLAQRLRAAAQLDGQLEATDIVAQVRNNVVPAGVAVRVAGKGETGQAVVARRGKQLERGPSLAPRSRRLLRRLEDDEVDAVPGQKV